MRLSSLFATFVAGVLCVSGPLVAHADETTEEILQILNERGLIDEAEYTRLLAKSAAEAAKHKLPPVAAALERIDFSGDLRLRYETFNYQHDPTGVDATNRERFRYRLRLSAKTEINDWVNVGMRFVSGTSDPVSTNRTLGDGDDFDTDQLLIDQAYAEIKLPTLREGFSSKVVAGKIPNPFIWKHGVDLLLWDGDITPEGGVLKLQEEVAEGYQLFANLGYLIDDEESSSADPKVIPVQLGMVAELNESLGFGARGSMYWWRALDASFTSRNASGGNLPGAFPNGNARIGALTAFFDVNKGSERWPVTFYGQLVKNFTAQSSVGVGDEDTGWLAGVELGNKKAPLGKVGFAWGEVEANAVVVVTTDSDMFDSSTNREGWYAYYSRTVLSNTDFNLTMYGSEPIETTGAFNGCRPPGGAPFAPACGPYGDSVVNSDRLRWRTDLVFKF